MVQAGSSQHPISVCDALLTGGEAGATSSQKRRRTMEAGEEEAGYGAFLRAMPTAHTYLGEVRDLPGNSDIRYELARSGGPLRCNLPLLPLPHQVLFPGDTLPLMIPSDDPLTRRLFHRAMAAPPPLKGLFCALTFVPEIYDVASEDPRGVVGTVMEIRQVSVEDDAREDSALSVVARGILRLRIVDLDWIHYLARHPVGLRPRSPCAPPRPWTSSATSSPRRPSAATGAARDRVREKLPSPSPHAAQRFGVRSLRRRPSRRTREAHAVRGADGEGRGVAAEGSGVAVVRGGESDAPGCVGERWRFWRRRRRSGCGFCVAVLSRRATACDLSLTCRRCGVAVAKMSDIVVSDGGATGSYVNPGGVVHDMVTVRPRNAGRDAAAATATRARSTAGSRGTGGPSRRAGRAGCTWGGGSRPSECRVAPENGRPAFERRGVFELRFDGVDDSGRRHRIERTDPPARTMLPGGEFYGILRRATVAAEDGVGRSRLRVPPAWPPTWPEGVDVVVDESQSDTSEGEDDDVDDDVDGSDGSDGGDGGDEAAREDPSVRGLNLAGHA